MGERKGVNKYYPPDWRPEMGSINAYHGTHALRERARKLHMGILIIRFEMPYNIWCDGCKNHIGMGVRYNAEKKKVGMYYSTPVYQFRFKCHLCPNYIEMKTDPGNLDYIIVSGARRQERRWDPTENEQVVPEDKGVSKKLATDAMFKLEHGEKDTSKSKEAAPVIEKLHDFRERWRDDYAANRLLRDQLRSAKKDMKEKNAKDAALLSKSSLSIKLLPETEEDSKTASLLRLNPTQTPEERQKAVRHQIDSRPIFGSSSRAGTLNAFSPSTSSGTANKQSESVLTAINRSNLGITVKPKENDSSPLQPKAPLAMSSLCAYGSSSDESV
uniref:EOG090X0DK6 n=1 Tax=Moina brachiata TaxID=675436 RepID=A0A4Y7NJ65_9CRUS|nr:EOG090X0DK6 [Moina brachiata]SVE93260.1 EOG090X0DK6 [Moina brachiata]